MRSSNKKSFELRRRGAGTVGGKYEEDPESVGGQGTCDR